MISTKINLTENFMLFLFTRFSVPVWFYCISPLDPVDPGDIYDNFCWGQPQT